MVTEELRPGQTPDSCRWPYWCSATKNPAQRVAGTPAITIDGCKLACAAKMVQQSGGTVAQEIAVLDVYRRQKDLKPQGIAELNEGGQKLAHVAGRGSDRAGGRDLAGRQGRPQNA